MVEEQILDERVKNVLMYGLILNEQTLAEEGEW